MEGYKTTALFPWSPMSRAAMYIPGRKRRRKCPRVQEPDQGEEEQPQLEERAEAVPGVGLGWTRADQNNREENVDLDNHSRVLNLSLDEEEWRTFCQKLREKYIGLC